MNEPTTIPLPCDQEVFKDGHVVLITHSIPSQKFEAWVQKVAAFSGQRVDWHFVAGRAVVKALGDKARVHKAIEELMPEHDALQKAGYDR